MLNKQRKNEAAIRRKGSSRDWLRINTFLWIRRRVRRTRSGWTRTVGKREWMKGKEEEEGRPTAQGVPRDTGRPGALMRKITRNKRRTGSAIIQNGYYNGPRHWLLLNPPPLPERGSLQLHEFNARARRATGNLSEILTHPPPPPPLLLVLLSFCRIRHGHWFRRLLRRQPFLYYFLQTEGVGISSPCLQLCAA